MSTLTPAQLARQAARTGNGEYAEMPGTDQGDGALAAAGAWPPDGFQDEGDGWFTDQDGLWDDPDPFSMGGGCIAFRDFAVGFDKGVATVSATVAVDNPVAFHLGRYLDAADETPMELYEAGAFDDDYKEALEWLEGAEDFLTEKIAERYGFTDMNGYEYGGFIEFTKQVTASRPGPVSQEGASTLMYDALVGYVNESDPGTFGSPYPYDGWLAEYESGHPRPDALRSK